MKILHVEAGMHLYGGAQQVLYIMQGLSRLGVSNVLACPDDSEIGNKIVALKEPSIKAISVKMQGDADFGLIFRLRKIILQEQVDLVHLHSRRGADVLGGIAARLCGIPCVLSRRVDNTESVLVAKLKYRLYDRIITISEAIKNVLLKAQVPAAKIICVRSAVDAEQYDRICEREKFNQLFGVSKEHVVIGMLAQFIPRKGHRYLLEALPEVMEKYPGIKVLLFGKGPLLDQVQSEIKQRNLQDIVMIAGFRSDLSSWLCCLDILVHPAEMEGLGVSLLQAAAAGVPIIGSRAGGIPEVIRDGENGLLIEPGDVQGLRDAMLDLLSDSKLRRKMGLRGKQMISKMFSIDVMAAGNLAVYKEVLGDANQRSEEGE